MKIAIIIEDMPNDQVNLRIDFDPPVMSKIEPTAASEVAACAIMAIQRYIKENQSDMKPFKLSCPLKARN